MGDKSVSLLSRNAGRSQGVRGISLFARDMRSLKSVSLLHARCVRSQEISVPLVSRYLGRSQGVSGTRLYSRCLGSQGLRGRGGKVGGAEADVLVVAVDA